MIALALCLLAFVVVAVLAARQAIAFEAERREEEAALDSIEESTSAIGNAVRDLVEGDPMVMTAIETAVKDARLWARVR